MGVSKNNGTPKSSILIGFSIINHPFWDTTIFGNIHIEVLFPRKKGLLLKGRNFQTLKSNITQRSESEFSVNFNCLEVKKKVETLC